MFKPRSIAIAGSIAALSLAGAPIATAASTQHATVRAERTSRDVRGSSRDQRVDRVSLDRSRDIRDR